MLRLMGTLFLGFFGFACMPEWQEESTDNGWTRLLVGACEAEVGKEALESCTSAKECTSYCCRCSNDVRYTVAWCKKSGSCADFGESCELVEADTCK